MTLSFFLGACGPFFAVTDSVNDSARALCSLSPGLHVPSFLVFHWAKAPPTLGLGLSHRPSAAFFGSNLFY